MGALLWDLRTALGAGVADAIAFHALQFIVPGATYQHACEALHAADAGFFRPGTEDVIGRSSAKPSAVG